MRPDEPLHEEEARATIENALQTYAERHSHREVILYVAYRSDRVSWDQLQQRAGLTPDRLRATLRRVERHLRREIQGYYHPEE